MVPIVGFYTKDTPYQAEAEAMRDSAIAVGIKEVHLYPVTSKGTWERNCQQKADILLRACEDLKRPFLYVDADARFTQLPIIGSDWCNYNIGMHYLKGVELLTGTIWVNPVKQTIKTLLDWQDACTYSVGRWDQRVLADVLRAEKITKVLHLAPEYTWIFDISSKYYGDLQPIIIHYQASRKYKRGVK